MNRLICEEDKIVHDIESMYKEHFQTVYKYLVCLTHNEDTAEELTQETFYKAIQN